MSTGDERRIRHVKPPPFDGTEPCHDRLNAELFFAPEGERAEERVWREREARVLCAGCPVTVTCALHGLEHEEYGIWGGLGEQDRPKLGGRGPHNGLGRTAQVGQKALVDRLLRAGFSGDKIKAILLLWKVRQRAFTAAKIADAREAARIFERAFSGKGAA